ncbi:MAG: hypothetical protein LQ343_000434 [Gyalolechia ehrenbergii]|nr:MAG: hypothetical protein LQ343_000434 [Gyalolechia ehrenbergii]
MSTIEVNATPIATAMTASVTRSETDIRLSPKQIKQLKQGILIYTNTELDASVERIEQHEREIKARPTSGPPKKVHRLLTRRIDVASIPKTDRVTRSKAAKTACPGARVNGAANTNSPHRITKPGQQRLRLRLRARAPSPEPMANGNGTNDAWSRIKRINCRFRIPGTDNIEYWRGGKQMICPPGVKPWER